MSSNLETRSLLDEWRNFDKGGFFDLGHPLLNRIAQSFVKAAGVRNLLNLNILCLLFICFKRTQYIIRMFAGDVQIGAIQAVAREACLIAVEGMHFLFKFI